MSSCFGGKPDYNEANGLKRAVLCDCFEPKEIQARDGLGMVKHGQIRFGGLENGLLKATRLIIDGIPARARA